MGKKHFFILQYMICALLAVSLLSGTAFSQYDENDDDDSQVDHPQTFTMPPVEAFIAKFNQSGGSELGSSQAFIMGLCDILGVPQPEAPRPALDDNNYAFEAQITFTKADGRTSTGRIDLYKKGYFIWESKQGSEKASKAEKEASGGWRQGTAVRGTSGWDSAMIKAKAQAEEYANGIPVSEGRPPFIIASDIGYSIELFADFGDLGIYTPFPSARENRIYLADLRKPEIRERLRLIWTDPLSLDPSRESEKVTKEIAVILGDLAKSLEASGHTPDETAKFLMRCVFTMHAEDSGLLPYDSFTQILTAMEGDPERFSSAATDLWSAMKTGGHSSALGKQVLLFKGYLFDDLTALPLSQEQLALLIKAAKTNWATVETSIFGTLLERALDPKERHKLGAHYTPTSYVERLVVPTIIEPLREDWHYVIKAALDKVGEGDQAGAIKEIEAFHKQLSETNVLDPSCGSGNFLAVSLSLMKDLEGEVLAALRDLGLSDLDIDKSGYTVSPAQFKGIEISPHAAEISELVLWLAYLQRHFKNHGRVNPPEPIIADTKTIECRDAILAWDTTGDAPGNIRYLSPRQAAPWPQAAFIVGNPPFIGNHRMREALGDGYVDALRRVYPEVPKSVDYVMYWWHTSAQLVRTGAVRRFGLITTNSISQKNNRQVVDYHLKGDQADSLLKGESSLYLIFAIPDHPWIDNSADSVDKAQVRIAMTVGERWEKMGTLSKVIFEKPATDSTPAAVYFDNTRGKINSALTVGVEVGTAVALKANDGLACPGVKLHGAGFIVTSEQAKDLGLGSIPGLENHIRPYRNGRDITGVSRDVLVIDLFGLNSEEVKRRYPAVYQHLLDEVKPERDKNNRATYKENWWIFGEPRASFRPALKGLKRYIVTPETARRRYFVFIDEAVLPDNKLIVIASDDAFVLGVLSSRIHVEWMLASGGRLGVGNDPVYVKTACFDSFPFPDATDEQKEHVRAIAEKIDTHRKEHQAKNPKLTLTDMYAVMEDILYVVHLDAKKEKISQQGDLKTLLALHQELDKAVAEAYGWPVDLPTEELLQRLFDLNQARAEEEKNGKIRWLRPEYQNE